MIFERNASIWPHLDGEIESPVYSVMTHDDSLPSTRENSQKYNDLQSIGGNRSFKRNLLSRLGYNNSKQFSVTDEATREGLRISKLRSEKLLGWQEPY